MMQYEIIEFRLSDKCQLEISSGPSTNKYFRFQNANYIGVSDDIDLGSIDRTYKENPMFYLGIRAEFNEWYRTVKVAINKVYLFQVDGSGRIIGKYEPEIFKNLPKSADFRAQTRKHIENIIDTGSKEGRYKLLKTLIKNTKDKRLPSCMKKRAVNFNGIPFVIKPAAEIKEEVVSIRSIIGTSHPSYAGKTWCDIYYDLKDRGSSFIGALINEEFEKELLRNDYVNEERLTLHKYKDSYYISQGNHRITLAKIMNLKAVKADIQIYEVAEEYEKYYKLLKDYGFHIGFPARTEVISYSSAIERNEVIDNWEVFIIRNYDDWLSLNGIEAIKQFYKTYHYLVKHPWQCRIYGLMYKIYNFKKGEYLVDGILEDQPVREYFIRKYIEIMKLIKKSRKYT